MTSSSEWRRIDAALDEILALPPEEWAAACARICGDDQALRAELESLLAKVGGEDPVLDFPAGSSPSEPAGVAPGLPPGTRVGAFRLVSLLGRGGMGEVYRAERADGHFEQQVAIKLMRPEVIDRPQRFHAERQILARLEHPNIAGLHDGGVADDGRLFMVMDLIQGQPITHWCELHRSPLNQRLQLFIAVCDAVAYAHRKLVVHRDLKPSNVFVTDDGQVKLLDFGVARLLDQTPQHETRAVALTPGYAAPEQLTGGQITTATDVYALGTLLFELVAGVNPWGADDVSLAALVGRVLEQDVPLASRSAAREPTSPVPSKLIQGDLDAIIAKAMRKEPESRYESVSLLQADVVRMLRSEPVSAREGARWYVAGRFLRRHRWGVGAAAVILLAVLGAAGGIAWQGHIAKQETARALAVKNFLIQVFRASDPRIASDKPRGQITAKELLDASVGRIETDFADEPELQLELLGITSEIYGQLLDDDRYAALMKQRATLARRLYGEHHPIFIESEIIEGWANLFPLDFVQANKHLARADALITEAGLDDSELRADWLVAHERALWSTPHAEGERRASLDRAIQLYAKHNPSSNYYPAAMANAATSRALSADYPGAAALNQRAIQVEEHSPQRDDADLAMIYGNLGDNLVKLGRDAEAERAYASDRDLAVRTNGMHYPTYWRAVEGVAILRCLRGDRDRAWSLFGETLAAIPADWKLTVDDTYVRQAYADCLVRDGRAAEAVPLLETALRVLTTRAGHDYDLRHVQESLGLAYAATGRIEEARKALQWALNDFDAHEPGARPAVLEARERWARFLIDHPRDPQDLAAAKAALDRVMADGGTAAPYTAAVAQAHADRAQLALMSGDAAGAWAEIIAADKALAAVKAAYDVRFADELLLLKAEVLAALQRWPEAKAAAALAVQGVQRHVAPQADLNRRANALMARLSQAAAT